MEEHRNGASSSHEFDLNEEWRKAWEAARKDFLATHGKDLGDRQVESPEDVLDSIRSKRERDDEDHENHKKAKNVIKNVLSVVQLLAGLAGQGASAVFGGPANMCSNAVSFLISAGARYKKIFADLIKLFDDVSSFLDRFKVYRRMDRLVDTSLKRVINEALLRFVSICHVGVSVLNHKGKLFFKSLVSGDGVQDELEKLLVVVERESKLTGALTYESTRVTQGKVENLNQNVVEVKGTVTETHTLAQRIDENATKQGEQLTEVTITSKIIASDQKKTAEMVKDLELSKEQREAREKVAKLLGLTDEGLGPYNDNISKKIPNTGEWLLADQRFKTWASRDSTVDYLLCLQGDEDMGKTFATYTAIQELKSQCQLDMNSTYRVSVACYFFGFGTQSVSQAVKSLAWQISQGESVFQKRLLAIERLDDAVGITSLWDKLFDQKPISDTTLFLVLDGLDHLEAEQEDFKQLLAHINGKLIDTDNKALNIRILLTATSRSYQTIVKSAVSRQALAIDMAEVNATDRELFIKNKLDSMFKKSSSQVAKIKEEVIQGLMAIEKKNFTNLDYILRSISRTSVPSEISELIDRAKKGEGITESIREEVRRLNTNLSAHDKQELNEMLLWVMYAARPLTVRELDTVLSLTRSEQSFQDLYEQIFEKYRALLSINKALDSDDNQDTKVVLFSEHVRTYFEKASAVQQEGSGSQDGGVNKSEVQILKRFLRTVCDDDLYYKFGFEEFLRKKIQDSVVSDVEVKLVEKYLSTVCDGDLYARVGFQEFFERKLGDVSMIGDLPLQSYSIHLASVCLKALCDPQAQGLHDYAGDYFPDHLKAVNLNTARSDHKVEVVQYLIRVFTDDEIIGRWWGGDKLNTRTEEWMFPDSKSSSVMAWFQETSVNQKVSRSDQDWLKNMSSKAHPDIELLRPVVTRMSRIWLTEVDLWYRPLFPRGISAFVNRIESINSQEPSRSKSLPLPPSQAVISEALAWAKKETSVREDCTYYFCLGETYYECELWRQALNAYEQALKFETDPNNWRAKVGLIESYESMANYEKVIQHATELRDGIGQGKYNPPESKDVVRDASHSLAKAYDKTGQLDELVLLYRSRWKDDPDDYRAIWGFAIVLTRKREYDELKSFFLDLKKDSDKESLLDRLSTTYCDNWYAEEHAKLAGSLQKEEAMFELVEANCQHTQEAVKSKLQAATSTEDKKKWSKKLNAAYYIYGLLLINFGLTKDSLTRGIELLERVVFGQELPGWDSDDFDYSLVQSARALSPAYLAMVKSVPESSGLCTEYVDRLKELSSKAQAAWDIQEPQQLLGRTYSHLGQAREARKSLRGIMKMGFDFLSDDNDENDWQGFLLLAQCLMLVDDKHNALAAWSLIGPTSEFDSIDDEGSMTTAETSTKLSGPLFNFCDGDCDKRFQYASDFWACCDCSDTQFCQSCMDKLKAGELSSLKCSRDHSHLHIPPWNSQEAAKLPKKHVKVLDDVVPIDEWVKTLKADWDLA